MEKLNIKYLNVGFLEDRILFLSNGEWCLFGFNFLSGIEGNIKFKKGSLTIRMDGVSAELYGALNVLTDSKLQAW